MEDIDMLIVRTNSGRRYINHRLMQQIRRRLTLIITIFIIGVAFASGASRMVTNAQSLEDTMYYKYHTSITVESGDTLSSIADEYADHFESKQDFIHEVMISNHLVDDTIYAGMNLIVPYYSEEFKH